MRGVSARIVGDSEDSEIFAELNITFDAFGTIDTDIYEESHSAKIKIPGQKYGKSMDKVQVSAQTIIPGALEFLQGYSYYVVFPALARIQAQKRGQELAEFIVIDGLKTDSIRLPSMNFTYADLRDFIGIEVNSPFDRNWVRMRGVSARIVGDSDDSEIFAELNITFDAFGTIDTEIYEESHSAKIKIPGQKYGKSMDKVQVSAQTIIPGALEFLQGYSYYVVFPALARIQAQKRGQEL
eukprot:CAMPEP_0176432634 /NCGR_PEP_ID=MMETSP0127-20121128/15506_1 /TAXON_ID=938130 /ORGANISM="Platyophrya macrostoma, Strain WH" /LENGTH=238 /DNA_ID=CAMNT_0017814833 /DNA_START=16 /DNA_END=728 /DNA_ORIENTATION=-